ncbi:MAG: PfkB family carbohydrate kinase [Burkholderiales bacterium]
MRTCDIVAIGEAMVEFNQCRTGEHEFLQGFGGDTSNMIIAAAHSGARTAYFTRIGDKDRKSSLLYLASHRSSILLVRQRRELVERRVARARPSTAQRAISRLGPSRRRGFRPVRA